MNVKSDMAGIKMFVKMKRVKHTKHACYFIPNGSNSATYLFRSKFKASGLKGYWHEIFGSGVSYE